MEISDLKKQIFDIAAAGARPHHKRFALDKLEDVVTELRDSIDGGDECRGRDSWISGLIIGIEYAMDQIRAIQ